MFFNVFKLLEFLIFKLLIKVMFLNRCDLLGKFIFMFLRLDVVFVSCVFVSLLLGGWLIDLKFFEGVVFVKLSLVLVEFLLYFVFFLGSENWRVF